MKKELRTLTLKKLADLSEPAFIAAVEQILHGLFNHPKWKDAKTIGVTVSRGKEIPTRPIIEQAWKEGKRVTVPKCHPKEKQLDFRHLTAFDELESVYYGLLEPIVDKTENINKGNIDLIIVPGVVFDPTGFRIGFGGGYYDRFLKNYHGATIALLLSEQLVEELPVEPHDIPVQTLITEYSIFECLSNE